MKKTTFVVLTLFLLLNCTRNANNNNGIIEVKERVFVGQVNDIYVNSDDYLGKTIKIEGLFLSDIDDNEEPYYAVFRYGPGGCCGIDGIVGLEVAWSGNKTSKYPNNDSWVEAIGELKEYKAGNAQILYMDLISLNVLDKRGREFVTQ